jgi:hypothetical protein
MEYRIFRLDNAGTVLGPSQTIKFENDQDAIEETRKAGDGVMLEIWEGPRRVATIRSNEEEQPRV